MLLNLKISINSQKKIYIIRDIDEERGFYNLTFLYISNIARESCPQYNNKSLIYSSFSFQEYFQIHNLSQNLVQFSSYYQH